MSHVVLRGRWCNIFWMCMHKLRKKWWFKSHFLWGIRTGILSFA